MTTMRLTSMLWRVRVARDQVGLVLRDGDLVDVLRPADRPQWVWGGGLRVHLHNVTDLVAQTDSLEAWLQVPAFREAVQVVRVADAERALVWQVNDGRRGRLRTVLGPGDHALWTTLEEIEVELVRGDATARVEHDRLDAVLDHPASEDLLQDVLVPEGHVGVLYVQGRVADVLREGRYGLVTGDGAPRVHVHVVDVRRRTVEVAGQELMTADKVTLRLTALAAVDVADPVRHMTVAQEAERQLYHGLQMALRGAVGSRTLDALLEEKEEVAAELAEAVADLAGELGYAVHGVGLRDVILPGEMKALLNQVIEAEKRAAAGVILRREETAATRNLANTAKLMEGNPLLLRLKELEVLEAISDKVDRLEVGPGLAGLLRQLEGRE